MDDENTSKGQAEEKFKCVGCKSVWTDKDCVVAHWINQKKTYFCLNCDDWLKNKTKVLEPDLSLFDKWTSKVINTKVIQMVVRLTFQHFPVYSVDECLVTNVLTLFIMFDVTCMMLNIDR